jgi:hypothetical protein
MLSPAQVIHVATAFTDEAANRSDNVRMLERRLNQVRKGNPVVAVNHLNA